MGACPHKNAKKGIILEVDLLNDLHSDYPCVVEEINVTNDMLSAYCRMIKHDQNISTGRVKNLIPTLSDKTNYATLQNLKTTLV